MLLRKLAESVLKTAEEHKLQGHTEVQGIPIAIENRKGSVREGTTEDGHHWRTKMKFPYGYIEGTKGADGEEIDAYVGPDKDAPNVYVVHQHKPDGTGFDEDKLIFGVHSEEEAKKLYLQHYDDPKFLGPISVVPVEKLKEKIEKGGVMRKIAAQVLPKKANCFFHAAIMAAENPELKFIKGTHSQQRPGDTAHFWLEDKRGRIVDPTASQYAAGTYHKEREVSVHKNKDYVLQHPLFTKLPEERQATLMKKIAAQVLSREGEFAPGIPSSKETHSIPHVFHDQPQTWHMAVQHHSAEKAGEHVDLRLVDKRGLAHSWAIPKSSLPKPGEKVLAVQQPTHTREYAARTGTFTLGEGYGKGTVRSSGLVPVEVVRSQSGILRFNVYGGHADGNQEYALIKTPKGHLLHNITTTAESGVRGPGGHPVPTSKPDYREIHTSRVRFDDAEEIHQAKVDGAHVTFHLRDGKGVKVFSYRPTERATGVLEHTHKLPAYRELIAPPGLAGTVLRGELYAVDKKTGKALPAEQVGGLLNAGVWRSREKQEEMGAELRPVIFDVVTYKGRDVSKQPYSEKLQILREVQDQIPRLKLPPTATTPEEKERLFHRIREGKEPITSEGIVAWKLPHPYPTKMKFRPDVDAEVVGVTPGKGKHEGRLGALQVRFESHRDAITNVGTGFTDDLREQIAKNPQDYVGRVVKVRTMGALPSGRLRAPSFAGFHLEKGKQPLNDQVKSASIDAGNVRRGTPEVDSFEDFKKKLRVGDVIFTKPGDTGRKEMKDRVLGSVVKAYDWLSGAKHKGWAHTAMYLGDGEIAHLYDRKLRARGLRPQDLSKIVRDKVDVFKPQGYDLVATRPTEGIRAARAAAERMTEYVERSEGISVPTFAKNLLRTGLTSLKGKVVEDAVCSGVVGEAYRSTGTSLSKRKPFSMRPKDFLESRKVDHLVAYSPDDKVASIRVIATRILGGKDGR